MEANQAGKDRVLILGNDKLSHSVAACLLIAGHSVTFVTKNKESSLQNIYLHLTDLAEPSIEVNKHFVLEIIDVLENGIDFKLAIVLANENISEKKDIIHQLEGVMPQDSVIAINTESIPLSILQEGCIHPFRIFGVNWVYPANTTYFLELITNSKCDKILVEGFFNLAKKYWNKDPYVVRNNLSIRAKLFASIMREAFYLVENGYASIEDIDRACRNDAGYYLPFVGNFRFMDLMGPYAYGVVMKDLNPDLSKENELPVFFKNIIEQDRLGMENNRGFYNYKIGEAKKWKKLFRKFSYEIQKIVAKYPFNYENGDLSVTLNKAKM